MIVEQGVTSLTDNAGYLLSRVGTAVQAGFKGVISGNMVELIDTLERRGYAERRRPEYAEPVREPQS